ncbi:glyoxalase [Rhodococcus sp. IEGM 248]|nr:glyoxalase [Rhodococcus sp. IEGM 248]
MSTIDTRTAETNTSTATTFGSTADLTGALIRAAIAHGEHEKRTGTADPNWPHWYAAYLVAEQAGTEPPR